MILVPQSQVHDKSPSVEKLVLPPTHWPDDSIVLVSASDEKYVMPLAVMLCSASRNLAKGRWISAHILDAGISTKTRKRFEAFAKSLSNLELNWHVCRGDAFAKFAITSQGIAAYTRLLIGEVLPKSLQRAIYIDCDIVVESDLWELWAREQQKTVGAVRDYGTPNISDGLRQTYSILGLPPSASYFNSGVLVVDLDRWRRHDIAVRVMDYSLSHSATILYADQDGLNAILCNDWEELDASWNVQVGALNRTSQAAASPYTRELFVRRHELFSNPKIIHFISAHKPWHAGRYRPVRGHFLSYLHRSGWFTPWELAKFHVDWCAKTVWLAIRRIGKS